MPLVAHQAPDFSVLPSFDSACLNVRITGNASTAKAQKILEEFLVALHEEVRRLHVGQVVVDIRELEFMNSSCLKAFVSFIAVVQETPLPKQYHVQFLSNPEMRWQRRSLHALSCFAVNLVTVET